MEVPPECRGRTWTHIKGRNCDFAILVPNKIGATIRSGTYFHAYRPHRDPVPGVRVSFDKPSVLRFLAAVSCGHAVVGTVSRTGREMLAVADLAPGADDERVLELALREGDVFP